MPPMDVGIGWGEMELEMTSEMAQKSSPRANHLNLPELHLQNHWTFLGP